MLGPIFCHGCGQRVEVPEGCTRSKLRCPECGVFNELPKGDRAAAKPTRTQNAEPDDAYAALLEPGPPVARPAPPEEDPAGVYAFQEEPKPKPAPKAEPKPPAKEEEREVLVHGTEDDDGNPYQVTGDVPTKTCPECDQKVERRAKTCVHCGFHFESGKKAERTYQPINRDWESGWPLQKRIVAFVVLQVVNFVTLVAALIGGQRTGLSFVIILFSVGLQAFLVGTFDRLSLTRNQKGKVVITRTWRYAFIPRLPDTVRWKEHETILIVRENEFDLIDWVMAFILLGYGCLPGIAFWWFVIRPDKFTVFLCKDHGSPETPLIKTQNEELAKEIQTVVSEATTIPVQK